MKVIGIALMCAAGMVSICKAAEPAGPMVPGRWVYTEQDGVPSPDLIAKACAKPLGWIDVSEKRFDSDGPATDKRDCLPPRWRRLGKDVFEGTPRKCNPKRDSLGDEAGPLRVKVVSPSIVIINQMTVVLCTTP